MAVDNRLMDHLQAIRMFARVVETGGFSKAARSLEVPNATVSKWVRSLEDHLDVKLLERTTRRVTVTTDGAAYYERMRHLLAELDDFEATLARGRQSPRGVLRVDTGGSVASALLIPALEGFHARYPEIQVQLSVTDRTADLVAENIDCAIRSTGDDPDLVTHRIGEFGVVTCASPAYLARHGVPRHPHDIVRKKMPVAGYFSASTGLTQPLRFRRGEERLVPEGVQYRVLVSESNAHLATALNGLGLVNTLDFMAREAIEAGRLVPVLTRWRPDPQPVYAVYPPSRRYSTKVRVFVDWARTLFTGR